MSEETTPELVSSPPSTGQRYFDRCSEDDPEYLRIRNMAADLRQDFNVMDQKKRVTMIMQSPSFREELESLIQEQMKKGNNSSNIWALRQIADFMASTAPSVFPTCPVNSSMVAPINDLHCNESMPLAKGERLMRCKLASIYRLIDLYGWAQLSGTIASIRVNKEQDHFLINPRGVVCNEVTASILLSAIIRAVESHLEQLTEHLTEEEQEVTNSDKENKEKKHLEGKLKEKVKVNILGEVVEVGSTIFEVEASDFSLHSAIYSARPDVKCIIQLHTAATTAVSAMKCGLLPISHDALLAGEVVYYDFNGDMEDEKDRIELQKCLGPTCKVLVLRNHGVVALGESVEEAFYKIFHLQEACEIQVSAVPCAGGPENLILLDRDKYRPHELGTVGWAGSKFGPMQKSRLGEHEFEALMRMMDNLGYRTGYTYRHPFVQEKTRHKSDVEIPATVTSFIFEEEGVPLSTLRQHSQKQQKEKTRWLNTPNTYLRVNVAEDSVSSPRTTWLKADEVVKPSSGMPIRIENPNQFVPLFTDPREVLETRNKIREQNRQDVKSAGPQSQLLASVITDKSRSPSADSHLATKTEAELKEQPVEEVSPEPETPNPFSQLTDQELEEYKIEVERKKLALDDAGDKDGIEDESQPSLVTPPTSPVRSPTKTTALTVSPSKSSEEKEKKEDAPLPTETTEEKVQPAVVLNGKEEDQPAQEESVQKVTETPKGKTETVPNVSPEGSPTKSPSKKKKKFRTPSFLKKGKKKEKEKAES